jgi:hypothetical protein
MSLYLEIEYEKRIRRRFNRRIQTLKCNCRVKPDMSPGELISRLYRRVRNKELMATDYDTICAALRRDHVWECVSTSAEREMINRFKQEWKTWLYPQTWIGNFCVDIFVPALGAFKPGMQRGYILKGLVFEIDGGIHQSEQKMKKDLFKEKSLSDIGIQVWRLTDMQVYDGDIPARKSIKQCFGVVCSRERLRIWGRIHLITILHHGSTEMIGKYFPKFEEKESYALSR